MSLPADFPFSQLPTPTYLIDQPSLEANGRLLDQVRRASGCRILLAQKAFACYPLYGTLSPFLDGAASSGLFEALLAREAMGEEAEVHVYAPAYKEEEFQELLGLVDSLVFNSFDQWAKYKARVMEHNLTGGRQITSGIRINPGYSEVKVALYNPAGPGSRMGVPAEVFKKGLAEGAFAGLSGIHFHSLCQEDAGALERTLEAIKEAFGSWPSGLSWVNFGGGHHISRPGYDLDLLVSLIKRTQEETGATVYLEPGEAVALNAGWLVTEVLDIFRPREGVVAILDTSAACHMPDVLEMPYRPDCYLLPSPQRSAGASSWYPGGPPGLYPYSLSLGGPSCLAGDVVGTYSFSSPPLPGDRIVFTDMAIYTMVKNNTFNGIPLPAIAVRDGSGQVRILKRFGYQDFKSRLG